MAPRTVRGKEACGSAATGDGGDVRSVVVEMPLGDAAGSFDLEKAVCSHGLFMMAPNFWDPYSKTFQRPLRLLPVPDGDISPDVSSSFMVRISQPSHSPEFLHLRVFGIDSLSTEQQQSLLYQVKRMLRLSEGENKNLMEFWEVYGEAKTKGFGRIFRSPTLFEDMAKCILLCNCQWSRTLSMARALCELQRELTFPVKSDNTLKMKKVLTETEAFIPRTPALKESKKKSQVHRSKKNLIEEFSDSENKNMGDVEGRISCGKVLDFSLEAKARGSTFPLSNEYKYIRCVSPPPSTESYEVSSCSLGSNVSEGDGLYAFNEIGNFPSPAELANLDESYLAKRCNLGYRARRILNLAKSVIEGRIQPRQLEDACGIPCLSSYKTLTELLSNIDGFGPFTSANVLMCIGFYHVIPIDSETIRHLKQVHKRSSTIRTAQRDVQLTYEKYAPFQFLVYWSELWHYYEEKFGKLSEIPHSDYKRITAANMKSKTNRTNKRIRISVAS